MKKPSTYSGFLFVIGVVMLLFFSCKEANYTPKPKAYFRIDFPDKEYETDQWADCPFSFERPVYSKITPYRQREQPCWFNLDFPAQRARIHFSYYELNNDLSQHLEDSRTLVYKHTVKAVHIGERFYQNPARKVYSIRYDIEGNAASAIQFYITDSVHHFLRGALYFASQPNADSLSPSIDFLGKDIDHFIEHFQWKQAEGQSGQSSKSDGV